MKLITTIALVVLFGSIGRGLCQGTFVNLQFENPLLPLVPINARVPITSAFPGWTGYAGTEELDAVFYNTIALEGVALSLQGPGSLLPPIQGLYSAIIQPGLDRNLQPVSAAIAQTGLIPTTSQSLQFYSGSASMQVTFGGHLLPLIELGRTPTYLILGADISGVAGQTGELRFTMPNVRFSYNNPYLDNIQFSPTPVPEPNTWALLALGGTVFWCAARWRWK